LPRRILFPFVGDSLGGSQFATLSLIQRLDASRYTPVVVLEQAGPLDRRLKELGLRFAVIGPRPLPGEMPRAWPTLARMARLLPRNLALLRRQRIWAVHTNDLRMHLAWGPAAKLAGRRFFWHVHVNLKDNALWRGLGWLADGVLVVSETARRTLPLSVREAAVLTPNPFAVSAPIPDRAQARAALAGELGLDPSLSWLCFVGNLARQKRPQVFVRALAALGRPVCGLLVGQDREGLWPALEAAAAAAGGAAPRLCFLGFRDDLPAILAAADVVVAPGVNESFGRVPVEAMLAGRPVVAAASGGHLETIADGKTGLLVRPDDADGFAAAIARVLDDVGLAARLAAEARRIATARYEPARYAEACQRLYDAIAARETGSSSAR
jgi:glycosyltransferase involved in cell wall biosynthesis